MTDQMSADEFLAAQGKAKKGNKYHAEKVELDGYTFDSKAEARRYEQLRLMQQAGKIAFLTWHPRFDLVVNGVKIGRYTADFAYHPCPDGALVVEDVKGVRTRDYVLRKKLVKALYGIEIVEVKE